MNLKQESTVRVEPALNRIPVGGEYRSFDRKFAASQSLKAGDLVALAADGYWHKSAVAQVDAAKWQANHAHALGDTVVSTAGSSDDDTEPVSKTDGTTNADGTAVWTDMGVFDTLAADHGVALEDVTSGVDEHPVAPVLQAGAVKRSAVSGLPPVSKPVGSVFGLLILC